MHTILLSLHILVASVLTLSALNVTLSAHKRRETKVYTAMLATFAATLVSGFSLLLVGAQLGRVCATMTVLTFAVLFVRRYYLARTTAQTL